MSLFLSVLASYQLPSILGLPFLVLLILIAIGPLFFKHWWHSNYKYVSVGIGISILAYYFIVVNDSSKPTHTFFEYFSFISLLASLYIICGGIFIQLDFKPTILNNVVLLVFGAILSNIIGTTGASVLLIHPFIRMNQDRYKPYLIVFFIFIVSNVGGSLTPIGDPPLFLGFLKGVPFEWSIIHIIPEWLTATGLLILIFIILDLKNKTGIHEHIQTQFTNRIKFEGQKNFIWLVLIIICIFLDPAKISFLPSYHGHSFIRECLQLSIAFIAYKFSDREALYFNKFSFEPILEVAFIFFGIFFSMMPALQLLQEYVSTPGNITEITPTLIYWGTGACSSVLDNAPSYLTFLTASMSYLGFDVDDINQVINFAMNENTSHYLVAISTAAVFFGAMTYIGNGPNFMVKSIVEESHKEMPSFMEYIFKYSIPYLFPVLLIIWFVFIR
jgi:Na+/H+ antiporter NhaD/arsenite permease-like protein